MGSSAALYASKFGHQVTVFDQFEEGHRQGSSHGKSRITRTAYPDPLFARIMMDAYPMWLDLESECEVNILNETGLLYFGKKDRPGVHQVVKALESNGEPHQVLSPAEVKSRFNCLRLHADEIAIFSERAGWIHAERALKAIRQAASHHCAEFVQRRIDSPEEIESNFDVVLIATGAWIAKFAPHLDIKVTLQTFAYVAGIHLGPVWIHDSPGYAYGFPTEDKNGLFKLGIHEPGLPIDPDYSCRDPNPEDLRQIVAFVKERFQIERPNVVEATACLYTRVPGDQFRFGQLDSKTWFCSTCSGHGFKLGPWSGRHLVRLALGQATLSDFPSFQLQSGP